MDFVSMSIATYIISVVVSFVMDIRRELEVFKDAADNGYKFNFEKVIDMGNSADSSTSNNVVLLIPIYNLMITLKRYSDYYNNRYQIFKTFEVLGMLEEMTKIEKEEYNKKRTGINALMVYYRSQIRIQRALVITLEDGSKIWYEYDKDENKKFIDCITIVKVEGRIAFLGEQEQKKEVLKFFDKLVESIIKQYEAFEEFNFNLELKKELNLEKNIDKEKVENKVLEMSDSNKDNSSVTFTDEQKNNAKTRKRKR